MMWGGPSTSSLAGGPSNGGSLAASQISPAFRTLSSDYGMVQINSRNQVESVQAQQINLPSMRYQQYIQGSSFIVTYFFTDNIKINKRKKIVRFCRSDSVVVVCACKFYAV